MKSLKGKFHITKTPAEYDEINLGYSLKDPKREAYYTMGRAELRNKIIESGVYTCEQLERIEREGCNIVIGNGLCVSPFSRFKSFLALKKSAEIIRGLKVLMEAVASDSGEVVLPGNNSELVNAFKFHIERAPNIFLRQLKDYYPIGLVEILHKKLDCFSTQGDYFPGKEGVLIIPIEDLFKIYLQVEESENTAFCPIVLITEKKKLFVWAEKNISIAKLLKAVGIEKKGCIVKGDLLRGVAVVDLDKELVNNLSQIFVISKNNIKLGKCINCGRCREVCPVELKSPHAMKVLSDFRGIIPFIEVKNCVGCGLCGYFCPGWKSE